MHKRTKDFQEKYLEHTWNAYEWFFQMEERADLPTVWPEVFHRLLIFSFQL